MATGDDPQAAGVAGDRVQVERHLERHVLLGAIAVGMPTGVANVVVAVAARVVEVVAEQGAADPFNAWVVEQAAEMLVLV